MAVPLLQLTSRYGGKLVCHS